MCEAEDQVWDLEQDLQRSAERMSEVMELVRDCERGIITAAELRDRVERPYIRRRLRSVA